MAYLTQLRHPTKQTVSLMSRNIGSAVEEMDASETPEWSQWALDASRACHNRRVFVTERGSVGLGPGILEEGDICAVLFGGTVPFVMRSKGNEYLLLGEAYVHGIMRGEAIGMCGNGDLQKRTFRLV